MREQCGAVTDHFERDRSNLIPILQKAQSAEGFLSAEAIADISGFLDISENDIYSVASFYAQFRFTRPGDHMIKVCLGTACHVRGGERISESLERALNIQCGETTEDYKFSLERVACIGCCALAPVMVIDEEIYSKVTPAKIKEVVALYG